MTTSEAAVLVADDNDAVRESLVEFLLDFDIAATGAASAEDALSKLTSGNFNLAIVDINLPIMGGDSLIAQAHQKNPGLKFFIYTGSADFRIPDSLAEIGMTMKDVYFKPIRDVSALINDIETKLASKAQEL